MNHSLVTAYGTDRGESVSISLTSQHKESSLAALTVAAVGIVYGDIGTSPNGYIA